MHEESDESTEQAAKPKQTKKQTVRKENKPAPIKSKVTQADQEEF